MVVIVTTFWWSGLPSALGWASAAVRERQPRPLATTAARYVVGAAIGSRRYRGVSQAVRAAIRSVGKRARVWCVL